MAWVWISVVVVLIGAKLDAEMGRQHHCRRVLRVRLHGTLDSLAAGSSAAFTPLLLEIITRGEAQSGSDPLAAPCEY
jgi:uncharacterized BrkB/YihY/UPF0761 family membrane protein